jgi:membrane protease YdiL (CAAX protease family)
MGDEASAGPETLTLEMQGRYFVGLGGLLKGEPKQLGNALRALNTGPVEQRLRYIVLVGEMLGPTEAQAVLGDLQRRITEQGISLSPDEEGLLDLLKRLYFDYEQGLWTVPSLNNTDKLKLRHFLGWYGDLALAPAEGSDQEARKMVLRPAYRTSVGVILAAIWFIGLGLLGFIGLLLCIGLYAIGRLRFGLDCRSRHGSIYLETFALWIVLFVALGLASVWLVPEGWRLHVSVPLELLSLSALLWPVIRGIPWSRVRQDLGLTLGRQPLLEPLFGIASYAMALPFVGIGFVISFLLMRQQFGFSGDPADQFTSPDLPSHPIVEPLIEPNWGMRALLVLLACVMAPLVEETMFRGVLHRYIRECTGRLGFWLSFLMSSLFVCFVFAVIHPQGILFVPVLMGMALGFTLAREWRGTLVPGMVAHALTNGATLSFAILALGR